MSHALLRSLAVAGALLLTPALAAAQEAEDPRITDARTRFERAEEHYASGNFALALEGYERAYARMREAGHPNAVLALYNVAQTNERLGRLRVALEGFDQFLVDAPADAPFRDEATRRAADLRRRLELEAQDRGSVEEPTAGGTLSPVGPILLGVGGAAAIAGATLGGVALADSDAARAGCEGSSCPPGARPDIESAQTLANVADALLFGGIAIAAAGLVLTLVLRDGPDEPPVRASASCGPTSCDAVLWGSFQ
ncbi:MAG: tetratricopeptide repeat protein [Sandaracinaceae bacterium]